MHQDDRKAQSHVCLICHRDLRYELSIRRLIKEEQICSSCLSQFEIMDSSSLFLGYHLHVLYYYNTFFKSLLFSYKGQYDYVLKEAFLLTFIESIKKKYEQYMVVCVPSNHATNLKRGFAPVVSIAMTFSHHVFQGLYKKEDYKQTDHSFKEREGVKNVIMLKGGEFLRGKKLLLFDDVMTSGETMKRCVSLCAAYDPACIEILVLASRYDWKGRDV